MTYTCSVCAKQVQGTTQARKLCPACHEEFHQWLTKVLQPLCKDGEEPLKKLYCFPRD